jgi:hypothetical protein
MGALIGALVLDQRLTAAVGAGIALVVASGAAVTWPRWGAARGAGASIRPESHSPGLIRRLTGRDESVPAAVRRRGWTASRRGSGTGSGPRPG